jgi:hypothetical protein
MVVKNLEFFDKDGYNLNLNWNEQKNIWEGNIFFPKVSVGLYENTTIYITELFKEYNGDDKCKYPTGNGNISFQWDLSNTFVDEFFMFNFDADYVLKDTSSLIYTPYDGPLCETLIINRFDKYLVPLYNPSDSSIIEEEDLLEVHVAFRSDDKSAETTYKRTLVISYENDDYTKYEIARITFFAETIEEDERLKIWNENLGYNLKPEESILFKQSDIHECMPNFELLNEKRKELMLEGHNIYPYIGGYKAIINAIKFFGYDNLNIIEYWRNINEYDSEYGRIYRTYVYSLKDRKTLSTKRNPISLNTKDFQKLSNISLVYNINHPEKPLYGEKYDEYGLPNVIEDFDKDKRDDFVLTIEEALVKLFALKKKLNYEFMPGSTKITGVIGEGNYFGINLIGNNPQISNVNYIDSKGYVDFSVFPNKHCYITENEDFARFIAENTDKKVDESIANLYNKTIEELKDIQIKTIDTRKLGQIISDLMKKENDVVCNFYEEYYNITYDNKFGDANKYGLRDIPEARNVYKDIIDKFYVDGSEIKDDPYGKNEYVPDITICAKVILKGIFSESVNGTSIVEWKITHPETKWTETYTGDVKTFGNLFAQLPYLGNYDVEMTVWDVYNHCSKKYKKDAIIVEPYNIDIRGFYYDARPLPDGLKYELPIPKEYSDVVVKDEKKYRYYLWIQNKKGVKKGIVTYKNNPIDMSISDIFGEYIIGDDKYNGLDSITDENREKWVSIINTPEDLKTVLKISWLYKDDTDDILCGVDEYDYAEELTNVPFDENDTYVPEWNKDELYHVIKNNVDKMYSFALQEHLYGDINTIMRTYKYDGSVNCEGPYYKFDVDNILNKIKQGYKEYDHLNKEIINLEHGKHYKYVRYINNIVDIKPLTWVLLGFDFTRITGRIINDEYPKWTLTLIGNELDPDDDFKKDRVIATHIGLYFTYLFEEEGVYKMKLEMKDINGNEYEIEKPIIIVDKDANYNTYHTLKDEYDKYLEAKNERNLIYLN